MPASQKRRAHDAFGESMSTEHALSFDEINDLGILRSSPSTTARFSRTIDKFVQRSLTQQPRGSEGYLASVTYMSDLAAAMEKSHHFSREQATQVHELVIRGWHKHAAEVLGRTLYSTEQLLATLYDIIDFAKLKDGAQPPAMFQLALHNAIANIECYAPPTPHSHPDGLFMEDGSPVRKADVQDEQMSDAPGEPDGRTEDASADVPALVDLPNSRRFSNPQTFFKHHAMRAKKAATSDGWRDANRQHAKSECKAEWNKMDVRTQSEWEDLFARCEQGEELMEAEAATSHLFRDGVSINIWSGTSTASPVAESKKRKTEAEAAPTDKKPFVRPTATSPEPASPTNARTKRGEANGASASSEDKNPAPPIALLPEISPYKKIDSPDRTCFLSFDLGKTTEFKLAMACKNALMATHGAKVNAGWHDYGSIDTNLFAICWRDVKTARLFEGLVVKCAAMKAQARAYPETPPSIFIAHMSHKGDQGIRFDAIHSSILSVNPGVYFHLRHEKIGPSSTVTVWMAVFKHAPGVLRFTTPIQTNAGGHRAVTLEPLVKSAACPVCRQGHSAVDCELFERAGKKELGVKKDSPGYLAKMPRLE